MKSILCFAICLSFVCLFGQCPQDTLIDGGFPNGEPQYSQGFTIFDECPHCLPFDMQSTWEMLDTGQILFVWGGFFPPCDTIQVRILRGCNEILSDTCLEMPLTGAGCIYEFEAHPIDTNAQILVYWRSANIDSIGVLAVSVSDGPILDSALSLLDTCGMVAIYQPPEIQQAWEYFSPYTLEKVAILQPNSFYLKRKKQY